MTGTSIGDIKIEEANTVDPLNISNSDDKNDDNNDNSNNDIIENDGEHTPQRSSLDNLFPKDKILNGIAATGAFFSKAGKNVSMKCLLSFFFFNCFNFFKFY